MQERDERAVRLLIYAMESSGASTFCYFLGQRPGSIAIIDVWSRNLAPPIDSAHPVVAKSTVTMSWSAAEHVASFSAERTILFIRDPVATYASLIGYPHAHRFGRAEDKLARFDRELAEGSWDSVIRYEDFVARNPAVVDAVNALGWTCDAGYWDTPRSLEEIGAFNAAASPWCASHFRNGWGFGNIKQGPISAGGTARPERPELTDLVARLAPNLFAAYRATSRRAKM